MAPCSSLLLLGAYYYTWYGVGEQWQVFPRPFEPTMGEYRSADDAVMRQVVSARHLCRANAGVCFRRTNGHQQAAHAAALLGWACAWAAARGARAKTHGCPVPLATIARGRAT